MVLDLSQHTRTVYMFGSIDVAPYGFMTFHEDGRVTTRLNPSEHTYTLDDEGVLSFISREGEVTSTLKHSFDGLFVPLSGHRHYLHPVFKLGPVRGYHPRQPVFVNTLPKAGTYLMAKALEASGYINLNIHAMDDYAHDNRGVPEEEIHWDPAERWRPVTADALAGLMRNGEFAVGHLNNRDRLEGIQKAGVRLINIVREPRSMLASMFTFRKTKTKPTSRDKIWHSMTGIDAFKAFLINAPLERWIDQIHLIVDNFPYLRYEDLLKNNLNEEAIGEDLLPVMKTGIAASIGRKTSTFSGGKTAGAMEYLDDPDVLSYLEKSGAMALSRKFWPELS